MTKILLAGMLVLLAAASGRGEVRREVFEAGPRYLIVETLADDLVHFEISETRPSPDSRTPIYSTPMVERKSRPGPTEYHRQGTTITTREISLRIDPATLCVEATDRARGWNLARICAAGLDRPDKTLRIEPRDFTNIYGLGNFFYDTFTADGDWAGREWKATGYGNVRRPFDGAAPTESQFPILYALGEGKKNFALFLDHPYRISWDFRSPRLWTADTWGDEIRWYLMTGPDLKDLRRDFLNLTGMPLIPGRSLFGLWVSKFGYLNWDDMRLDLESLRKNRFPVDGFGLDIQWFGGTFNDATNARMGSFWFDPRNFPNADRGVRRLSDDLGINLMLIEESYVDDRLPEHALLMPPQAPGCFLARTEEQGCTPVKLGTDRNPLWWGRGGMIDWTHPLAGRYWHDLRRRDLSLLGITTHWLDLGEPEMFDPLAWYHGVEPGKNRHIDIHNLYNLKWAESVHDGYTSPATASLLAKALKLPAPPRYFSMSRAGAPGMQRFAGGLWSGDIGRNMGSLRAHLNTQMNMSLAGIDYYNSDVGGFIGTHGFGIEPQHTDAELYTQWFANSALGEIPLRPHGWSYSNEIPTFGPDRQGHRASNRSNLLLRYELFPYYYSLAHRAYRFGEPIFPPLVYHYQDDPDVRRTANVKMIGDSLLYGVVIGFAQTERRVYLPKGKWVHYHTRQWFSSNGEETPEIPIYLSRGDRTDSHGTAADKTDYLAGGTDGTVLTLPLFARAGAIIPTQYVDDATLNISGRRSDRQRHDELRLLIVPSAEPTAFTVFEDDGVTLAYRDGSVRETPVRQRLENGRALVSILPATGGFSGAPNARAAVVDIIVEDAAGKTVLFNGKELPQCAKREDLERSDEGCWTNDGRNRIAAKTPATRVNTGKDLEFLLIPMAPVASASFVCTSETTQPGEAIYVTGNIEQLGNWDPEKGVRLLDIRYPRWARQVDDLPPDTTVEWQCIKRNVKGGAAIGKEAGQNHSFRTPRSGFAGTFKGHLGK